MALSWNEIKDRALKFSNEWKDDFNEEAEAKSFLEAFFNVFGLSRKKVDTFEHKVKKLNDHPTSKIILNNFILFCRTSSGFIVVLFLTSLFLVRIKFNMYQHPWSKSRGAIFTENIVRRKSFDQMRGRPGIIPSASGRIHNINHMLHSIKKPQQTLGLHW